MEKALEYEKERADQELELLGKGKLWGGGGLTIPMEGNGDGTPTKVELALFVQNNLGRLDNILMYMQEIESQLSTTHAKSPTDDGKYDVSFDYGNDVNKAVKSEFGMLANEATKLSFFVKLANNALLLEQPADRLRTPTVLCIDCSGSMAGTFYEMAVAFVMAVMKRLHADARGAAVIQFSGNVEQVIVMEEGKTFNLLKLLSMLSSPSYGGTNFDAPLLEAFRIKAKQNWKNVIVMLVSDDYGRISQIDLLSGLKQQGDMIIAAMVSGQQSLNGVDELYSISRRGNIQDFVKIGNKII